MRDMISKYNVRLMTLLAIAAMSVQAAAFELNWHTINGGGGTMSGGDFELTVSIGQPDAGVATGGEFEMAGGFIPGAATGLPGDCDGDGDVDLDDLTGLAGCMSGPNGDIAAGCGCFDLDHDEDIDLADFARFQAGFTGE